MATNAHVPGGEGELPIGAAKGQAKEVWDNIKTPAAFDALSTAEKIETLRKLGKYSMMRWFGLTNG